MAAVIVNIAGRTYRLSCDDGEEPRLEQLARYVEGKIYAMRDSFKEVGEPRLVVMAALAIADEAEDARSKVEAERALAAECARGSMIPIVLRLPLVYGPGVKGNFLRLLDAVARCAPLPFGAVENRRGLLFVGNLVHAIAVALDLAEVPAGTWFRRR